VLNADGFTSRNKLLDELPSENRAHILESIKNAIRNRAHILESIKNAIRNRVLILEH